MNRRPHASTAGSAIGSCYEHRKSTVSQRIAVQPPSRARAVIPVSVIEQVRLVILVFGREPEGDRFRHWSCSPNDFPEGAFEASPRLFPMSLNSWEMQSNPRRADFSEDASGAAWPAASAASWPSFLAVEATAIRRSWQGLFHGADIAPFADREKSGAHGFIIAASFWRPTDSKRSRSHLQRNRDRPRC